MTQPIPKETLEFFKGDEIRARCFYEKYSLRDENGVPQEKTPDEMWRRVAHEIASVEQTEVLRRKWEDRFYWLLSDFRFVAGGRIMFAAGNNKRRVTLCNCYVIEPPEDNLASIFECAKRMALTYAAGGGCGTDLSNLRPKGAPVSNSALTSTGAVSFMDLYSLTTGLIGQSGRRGALMLTLDVSHPDIEDFIEVKHNNLTNVRYANISVKISDEFMESVRKGAKFRLHWESKGHKPIERWVDACELWNRMIQSSHDSAEPNMLFWDRIKQDSTLEYNGMNVVSTNPCGEKPLASNDSCDLGSINLSAFVKDAFTDNAHFDMHDLEQAVRTAVRFLDNVLTYNADKHPLPEQREMTLKSRQIGLGFTGLGDALVKLGIKYDSDDALAVIEDLFSEIRDLAYDESVNLSLEKGPAQGFDADEHLKMGFVKRLPRSLKLRIQKQGLRNLCILTVPPVGSGSVLCGTSSGIEPIFALYYLRRSESLSQNEFMVYHPLVKEYLALKHLAPENMTPKSIKQALTPAFVTAHEIDPVFRVKMQATIQKYIDSSISSTINLPEDISVETVSNLYMLAWELGCKGLTVYREGSREGILKTIKDRDDTVVAEPKIATSTVAIMSNGTEALVCPSCGSHLLIYENGCMHCPTCGWEACQI